MSRRPIQRLRIGEMIRSLVDADIDFLVFGSVAAALHGHLRATVDLDIVVDPAAPNLDRVLRWLGRNDARLGSDPDRPLEERHRRSLHMGRNAYVVTPYGELDIVVHIPGLPSWEALSEDAVVFDFHGRRVRAVDKRTLIERKRARGSRLDLDDIEKLEALDDD